MDAASEESLFYYSRSRIRDRGEFSGCADHHCEGASREVTELDTMLGRGLRVEFETNTLQTRLYTTHLEFITVLEASDLVCPWMGPAEAGSAATTCLPTRRNHGTTPASTTNNPTTTVTNAQLQALIDQGVAAALAERDASRSRDGDNSHGFRNGRRRHVAYSTRMHLHLTFEVTAYKFQRTMKGVGLTQWRREKMEFIFLFSNCANYKSRVKVLLYLYSPRKCLDVVELHNGTDLMTYINNSKSWHSCVYRMCPEETAKVESYVGCLRGLLRHDFMAVVYGIKAPVIASEAIDNLLLKMWTKRCSLQSERQEKNKRKLEDTSWNNSKTKNNHSKKQCGMGFHCWAWSIRTLWWVTMEKRQKKTSRREELREYQMFKDFKSVLFPWDARGIPPTAKWNFKSILLPGAVTVVQGTLSTWLHTEMKWLSDQLKELLERLYKTQVSHTWRCSGLVCQEERWIIPDVH
ncbi:hypothetical protein Tco_0841083 [Tanacetum coccineum]|uniref:Uncharacterized protein n=1 Tax=Tanacetum coccineum TaxID=301880 RepID=A0ABQ5AVE8_9ASTR